MCMCVLQILSTKTEWILLELGLYDHCSASKWTYKLLQSASLQPVFIILGKCMSGYSVRYSMWSCGAKVVPTSRFEAEASC